MSELDKIVYGRKVVLFPMEMVDFPQFLKLHREDSKGYLMKYCLKNMTDEEAAIYLIALLAAGQIKVWSVFTKEGRKSHCIGFIYLSDMTSFSATITGIMDSAVAKGVVKLIRHGKYTFSEDTLRAMYAHCFNGMGLSRLDTQILANNRRALNIAKKAGFIEEGRFRDAYKCDDAFYDIITLAILKKETENG